MPITLAEAKLNVQDDLQMGVIDEFRKSSFLFENFSRKDIVKREFTPCKYKNALLIDRCMRSLTDFRLIWVSNTF